jgi:hypothetical protein
MFSRGLVAAFATLLCTSAIAMAQAPTPTPPRVDSNVAVGSYAQSNGQDLLGAPCAVRGGTGCGGCYPQGIPPSDPIAAALAQLPTVDPEWQAISTMISGLDASLAPMAMPVLMTGTVGLSKSPGSDFPASHYSPDYNAEIIPDNNGMLATGNTNDRVEFEWEGDKLPMFAWSGEGDRMIALGRWIFDCGHPDPGPLGKCSNDHTKACVLDSECSPGTCTTPPASFGFQSELHPPQAVVLLRNKAMTLGHTVPATRADVYISGDGGGAGDRCTVTHLANATDLLSNNKRCMINHCSKTTSRSCKVDADCAGNETCVTLDPANRLAHINAPNFDHCSTTPRACTLDTDCPSGETCVPLANFEFDMPLPPPPATGPATLKIKTTNHKPKGGVMPKPTFVLPVGPTPNLHVVIPMATPMPGNKMPNVFAASISAAWKEDTTWKQDTTKLKHVQVQITGVTINNPVKDSTPAVPHVCTNPSGHLTAQPCSINSDCTKSICAKSLKECNVDADCKKTDFCISGASQCVGGIPPGWDLWGEVNGDWVKFQNLASIGAQAPFAAPPYLQPSPTPLTIKQKFKFDEYVPPDGSIHLKISGHSLNCLNGLFGSNLVDGLNTYDLLPGAACLDATSHGIGEVDLTYTGPNFGTVTRNKPVAFTATSTGSEGGTCSTTANQLCVTAADCPSGETCSATGRAFTLQYSIVVK